MRGVDAWVSSTERSSHPAKPVYIVSEADWGCGGAAIARQSIFYSTLGDSASVLPLSRAYTTSQHGRRRAKKDPATPSSTPSHFLSWFWLYPCLSLRRCHLSYRLKGSQMPSHLCPWSCQKGAWKLLVTKVSPQPLKSKGPGALFLKKQGHVTVSKLSCDQSPSVNAWQGYNTVRQNTVCTLWHFWSLMNPSQNNALWCPPFGITV